VLSLILVVKNLTQLVRRFSVAKNGQKEGLPSCPHQATPNTPTTKPISSLKEIDMSLGGLSGALVPKTHQSGYSYCRLQCSVTVPVSAELTDLIQPGAPCIVLELASCPPKTAQELNVRQEFQRDPATYSPPSSCCSWAWTLLCVASFFLCCQYG
jgi:hypothetical protein